MPAPTLRRPVGRIWWNPRTRLWHGRAFGGLVYSNGHSVAVVYATLERQYHDWVTHHLLGPAKRGASHGL